MFFCLYLISMSISWQVGRGVHLPNEFLLRFLTEVAMHGGLDFEELLDDVLEVVCFVSCISTSQSGRILTVDRA